jgi:hypothetical protein
MIFRVLKIYFVKFLQIYVLFPVFFLPITLFRVLLLSRTGRRRGGAPRGEVLRRGCHRVLWVTTVTGFVVAVGRIGVGGLEGWRVGGFALKGAAEEFDTVDEHVIDGVFVCGQNPD